MSGRPERHSSKNAQIAEYLATGHGHADDWYCYPGRTVVEKMSAHSSALRSALLSRVVELELERAGRELAIPVEALRTSWLRDKLSPMVEGLFGPEDQPQVLEFAAGSVVFLTRDTVHRLLRELRWGHCAWNVARIWLRSIDAPPLSEMAASPLGMSQEKTCYVSLQYFQDREEDPFADYVVHEVAHLFHNNKRRLVGLPVQGRCEWILDIEFRKRELFAYACEVFSRIVTSASSPRERKQLVEVFAPKADGFADELDPDELVDILRQAARARNGWRAILRRCSPTARPRGRRPTTK